MKLVTLQKIYNMTKLYAYTILFGFKTRNFDTTNITASTILHCHRMHPDLSPKPEIHEVDVVNKGIILFINVLIELFLRTVEFQF